MVALRYRFVRSNFCLPVICAMLAVAMQLPGAVFAAEGGSSPAASSSGGISAAPATPVADFRNQLIGVKKSLAEVNGKIEERARTIEALSKPGGARQQVEELQALISQTLSLVADNGQVAQLGAKALDYARAKQDQMRKDTKFTPAERANLQRRWDQNVVEMTKATDELAKAGTEFVQLLKTVQNRGDYASELLEVDNAGEMVKVIQNLAADVRGASAVLKTFIQSLTPPEA